MYNYKEPFKTEQWYGSGAYSIYPNYIGAQSHIWHDYGCVDSYSYFEISPDYTFNMRFTYTNSRCVGNNFRLRLMTASGKSLDIKARRSDSSISINLNGDKRNDYAIAEYAPLLEEYTVNDIWVEYNGVTQTLYVYAAKYDESKMVTKPSEPLITYNIDLAELFEGDHQLYIEDISELGAHFTSTVEYVYGIEIDPYPELHVATPTPAPERFVPFSEGKEHFGGDEKLRFGFIAGDYDKASNVVVNGFEIAKTPFKTLLPDEYPIEEQDKAQIVSMGDPNYGYKTTFVAKEWTGGSIYPNYIVACAGMTDHQENGYLYPVELAPDYSFSGRITMQYNESFDRGHYVNFVLSTSPYERYHSVSIHMDILRTGESSWRNEFGEPIEGQPDGWYSGDEPFDTMIAVNLNGNDRRDYAIAEYAPFEISGAVHDVWFNYDGTEQKLYVYVATYDEEGNVTKPDTPTLICPLDLEEVFCGTHEIYLYYAGINPFWAMGNFEFFGMEFDPRPDIHNDFDGVLQVLAPLDDREYYIGDIIDISGRTGPMADPDTDITVVINDKDGNEVYRNDGDVSDNFGYIDRIPTDDMDPGEYTIVLTVTDENGDDFVKEIPIKLKKEITLSAELEGVELVEGGIAFSGSIDCNEDSSYELQLLTYNDEEEPEWTVFATGDGNKSNGVLGVLPTEGLATGTYTIRLTVTSESAVSVMGIIWSLFWLVFFAWVCLNMGLYKEMKILLFPFASLVVSVIGFAFSKRRGVKRIRLFVFQAVLLFLSVDLFQGIGTEKMYRYAFQLPIMILSLELIAFTELYQSMAKSRIKRINGNKSKSSN